MATTVNYSSLFQDVVNTLERGGSAVTDQTVHDQIPRLINAAERKIMQTLKLLGTLEVLVDPTGFSAGVSVLAKPDRWRATASIFYGGGTGNNTRIPVLPRSYEFCRSYWPDDTQTDAPLFYADYSYQAILIAPTPDATYPIEWNAYMQPQYLDQNNQNNFWSEYTPNLLYYSVLLEASPFLKDDSRIPTWQGLRDFELQTLVPQDLQRIMDRTAQRDRP